MHVLGETLWLLDGCQQWCVVLLVLLALWL
jgi:hypothetical protein